MCSSSLPPGPISGGEEPHKLSPARGRTEEGMPIFSLRFAVDRNCIIEMGIAPPRTLSSAEQERDCGCDRREGGEEGEKLIKVRRELMGDTSCARGSCGVLGWRSTIRTG